MAIWEEPEEEAALEFRLDFENLPWQQVIEDDPHRFKVVKAGRRTGKSKKAVNWQLEKAVELPNEAHWYLCPTHGMAQEIAWREYLLQIPEGLIEGLDRRKLVIELKNGSHIHMIGSQNEDGLRGRRLGSLVMDEAAFQKPHVWQEICQPMLADLQAPALFISSPKRGWFTRLFEYAKNSGDPDWAAYHFTIYDNPKISRGEIERIRKMSPSHVWQQEYMAQEVDFDGQVYIEFLQSSIVDEQLAFPDYRNWKTVCGIDWGYSPDMTGVVWLHIHDNGTVLVSREHLQGNWDASRHAAAMERIGKELSVLPGDYCLDQSAFRKGPEGQNSIAQSFAKSGVSCSGASRDKDGTINLMKLYLRGNGNQTRFYVSNRCQNLIQALNEWEWSDHEPDILAACRYGLAHAVRRGYTKPIGLESSVEIAAPEQVKENPHVLKLPPRKVEDIQWDFESGGPF